MAKERRLKVCKRCLHDIDLDKQKFVLLGTYEKKKILEESFYHWICFVEWYEGNVKQKAENIVKDMQQKTIGMVRGIMQKIGGIEGM